MIRSAVVLSFAFSIAAFAVGLAHPGCVEQPSPMKWENEVVDQGLNESEERSFEIAAEALLELEAVHMLFTLRDGVYEIHSRQGVTRFVRERGEDGFDYRVLLDSTGPNPVENQDPRALLDWEEMLATGDDPNDMCEEYRSVEPGFDCPDPRVFFPKSENLSYPLAYERISALFDNPRAPDFVIEYEPYIITDIGNMIAGHGHLNVLSTRAALAFIGPGVEQGRIGFSDETNDIPVPRAVDVAPTVAHLLGVEKRTGIDASGRLSHDVYLKRQDGRVLEEILSDSGDRPKRVVVISHDALMPAELYAMMEEEELLSYELFLEEGSWYDYGMISNWPTNTFASLNTIGTGTWSGRHGVIDNAFFIRETKKYKSPITEIINFSRFVTDEVESLYQAVHRSFPNWHPEGDEQQRLGNFTAALNNPCGKDADLALIDMRETYDWNRCMLPPEVEERYPMPSVDQSIRPQAQAVDNMAVTEYLKLLFGRLPNGERCTPIPRLVFVNFALTDDVAHYRGPQSDAQRAAMRQTDERTQIFLEASREAGIFDETLFVLVSDHGQILVDKSRLPEPGPILDDLGLKYRANDQFTFVYLFTIAVDIDVEELTPGEKATVEITARDDDDEQIKRAEGEGERGKLLPDADGAVVEIVDTGETVPLRGGKAEAEVVPSGDYVHLRVLHPDYSPRDVRLPVEGGD